MVLFLGNPNRDDSTGRVLFFSLSFGMHAFLIRRVPTNFYRYLHEINIARKSLTDDDLRKIIEEIDSDEEDWESVDNVEEQIENTDEIDLENDSETQISANSGIYISKSGFQWQSHPIPATRKRAHNFVNTSLSLKNASLLITSVLEAFKVFMTDNMLSHICEYTNRWGNMYTDKKN
ncbi:hypothetical protein HHI36_018459 [Cryptolaemus montrouzieri]|uniref:Uncharacterized protein n=1 Tax=Cryptolaemus montrouzieri TaxID=559131 RepID=A0ABD2P0E1_9CUCU